MSFLERSHNALFFRKLPFVDSFVCLCFPTDSLKNREVSEPGKRAVKVQVLWQKKDVQAVFLLSAQAELTAAFLSWFIFS